MRTLGTMLLLAAIASVPLACGAGADEPGADVPKTIPDVDASTDAIATEAQPSGDANEGGAAPDVEGGIYAVVRINASDRPFGAPSGELAALIAKPYVHGIVLMIAWAELEPQAGVYDKTLVSDAVAACDALARAASKRISVKVILRNGLVPDWLVPASLDRSAVPAAPALSAFPTTAGYTGLATMNAGKLEVTMVPTDPGFIAKVKANLVEMGNQLAAADPQAVLVPVVQLPGPSGESGGSMRLTPRETFPRIGPDTLGVGWTFAKHLAAWQDVATFMAKHPLYAKRNISFDFTHEVPNGDALFGLTTAEQATVPAALVAAHPRGAAAVRSKNEGLCAHGNRPAFPATPKACDWTADNFDDPLELPESAIAAAPRHEWQWQVERSYDQNLPRTELARVLLFRDPKALVPTLVQGTDFLEVHDDQILDDATPLADGLAGSAWLACLDSLLRRYRTSPTLTAADKTFWAAHPSLATMACGTPYPPPPAEGDWPCH